LIESTIRAPTGCATTSAVADWSVLLWVEVSNPVVSNTTPLITLGEIGLLPILQSLNKTIWIPQAVFTEYQAGVTRFPARPDLTAIAWIAVHTAYPDPAGSVTLDPGESEAIALARANNARLLLMDEQRGRMVAAHLGLVLGGSLGVLIEAKQLGLIPLVQPYLDQMIAQGRCISPQLRAQVLALVGE
jgi:predicted nucleic acid-binding protein